MADLAAVAAGRVPVVNGLAEGEIPRIVHRIWLDEPMPERFRAFGEAWRDLHPGWTVKDWTCTCQLDGLRLLGAGIRKRAKTVIPRDWKRFVADVLRLELLHEFGGLYVDTDVEPHRPFDDLLMGRRVLVARSPNADARGYHAITNCVMAAVPGHPYIRALIDGLGRAIRDHGRQHLARMIGPWHLDRTYAAHEWPDVDVLDWPQVTPWLTHYWNNGRRKRGEGLG